MNYRYFRKSAIELNSPLEGEPIQVVGDAAIATQAVGDGRLIPLLILWTKDRPDIADTIRAHEHFPEGDVNVTWASPDHLSSKALLILQFKRPIKCTGIVEFAIERHGIIIESILSAHAVYLQAGKPGDRYVTTVEEPRLLVEIPDTNFRPHWDKAFRKSVIARLKTDGLPKSQCKRLANEYIEMIRAQVTLRVGH